jgi:hypothetical protein
MNKEQWHSFTGDLAQVISVREYRMVGGKADGLRVAEVKNGSGLQFSVLVDRCMDIGELSFQGVNFSFLSKAGFVAPQYYDDQGNGWSKTFGGGMLVTCGLENVGNACHSDGIDFGQHGSIGNTPAEQFSARTDLTEDGTPYVVLEGVMRYGRLYGPNLRLKRKLTCYHGLNKIFLEDTIENLGQVKHPLMLLYHFNTGYPLLAPDSCFTTSATYLRGRDNFPELQSNQRFLFGEPLRGIDEHCFYYQQQGQSGEMSFGALYNERLGKGISIWSKPDELPYLTNWRSPLAGDYCMGIEPGNCFVEGLYKQKNTYTVESLEPFAEKQVSLVLEMLDTTGIEKLKTDFCLNNEADTPLEVYSDLYSK